MQQRSMWREIFTPVVMMYTLAYFCLTNTLSAISIWTPQILQSFNQGSSNITIGLLAAVPQICTILGMIYWSRHSDHRQERRHHTALPYLFAAAGWLLASATDHNMIQMLGIIMASTGSFSAMAIFWTTPDQSISLRARAIGIAVINATGNIGSALSPFMIGWLKDLTGSFNSGLWFVAALLVIGAGIIWAIQCSPPVRERPRKERRCVTVRLPILISAKSTMKAWVRTMCIISRSPAWRHFWPPYAATSPRTVLSDAFPQ